MRFRLDIHDGFHFFDTLPDMLGSLAVANAFKPFEENCRFEAAALSNSDSVDLVIVGIKFEDYTSFGLSDETRREYDKFVEKYKEER